MQRPGRGLGLALHVVRAAFALDLCLLVGADLVVQIGVARQEGRRQTQALAAGGGLRVLARQLARGAGFHLPAAGLHHGIGLGRAGGQAEANQGKQTGHGHGETAKEKSARHLMASLHMPSVPRCIPAVGRFGARCIPASLAGRFRSAIPSAHQHRQYFTRLQNGRAGRPSPKVSNVLLEARLAHGFHTNSQALSNQKITSASILLASSKIIFPESSHDRLDVSGRRRLLVVGGISAGAVDTAPLGCPAVWVVDQLVAVLLVLPVADELIGRRLFHELCKKNSVHLHENWKDVRRAKSDEPTFGDLYHYPVRIRYMEVKYRDMDSGEIFLEYRLLHNYGGFLMDRVGLRLSGAPPGCDPIGYRDIWDKLDLQRLVDQGKSR